MARYASSLLINVNDLLHLQGVEKQKVEFKKAWHGKQGPRGTYWQVVHTICAYANDFFNDNGGYIIIGVDEKETWEDSDDRQVNYPPVGVSAKDLERIQREILGACRAQIKPDYHPVLSPEMVECPDGIRKHVLVIWAMASDNKPHTCKENEKGRDLYYVRQGTETKMATPVQIEELLRQGNKIPFDDRRAIDYGKKSLTFNDSQRSEDGRSVLESIQNAHKLFEAMGDVTQTNSYVAFQFACCKFDLYINTINQTDKCHNKQHEKHRDRQADRHRKDLIPYLKEAEDYVNKAIQLTNEEYKHHQAMQYRQLGYIHSQLYLIKKSTVAKITAFYDKARKYNPKIKISRVFIPPEYQSQYMPTLHSLESPLSDTSFEW
ncbi:hypothetical protein AWC38_SpisGene13689 [Stylophora pistillata]|uniref:Schlafen AlbA-2 domain-containing protein n=1 Tax=Stylophora pistillata TaxID=50429 RepID=A0A2B4RYA3_STYPI|nr:hypothetical protein AWC38_SpisGene13689 [Stylophora pistillata]